MRQFDVILLPMLGASGKENDKLRAILPEINSVAWAEVEPKC